MFESLRSMAVMTQVRGQPTPGLSPPFVSFRLVWDSVTSLLELDGTLVRSFFWLVRAMRANLRAVEVESQIASHLRRDWARRCDIWVATWLQEGPGPASLQVLLETVLGVSSSCKPRRGRIHPAHTTKLGPLRLLAVTTAVPTHYDLHVCT